MITNFSKYKFLWLILCLQIFIGIYFFIATGFTNYFSSKINEPDVRKVSNGKLPRISEDISKLSQTDAQLISFAKQFILPPSKLPYTFDAGYTGLVMMIFKFLEKTVKDGKNGYFVEAGAYDGVAASNTVGLEILQNWTGLLVECHPKSLALLKTKQRKSFIAQACLSASNHSQMDTMTSDDEWNPSSSITKGIHFANSKNVSTIEVPTFPLFTLLAAVDVKTVDFFSLDIEGMEYNVLKNFPFDRILVKIWLIEVDKLTKKNKNALLELMIANGYGLSLILGVDMVFVHKSVT